MTYDDLLIELDRLEVFLKATKLPQNAIQLGGYTTISKPESFISTSILRARNSQGSVWQSGCLFRLHQLEKFLLEQ